jgi:hypothetical protein
MVLHQRYEFFVLVKDILYFFTLIRMHCKSVLDLYSVLINFWQKIVAFIDLWICIVAALFLLSLYYIPVYKNNFVTTLVADRIGQCCGPDPIFQIGLDPSP